MGITFKKLPTRANPEGHPYNRLDTEISITRLYRHHRELEEFLRNLAEMLLPKAEASPDSFLRIPLDITVPVTRLYDLTPYTFQISALHVHTFEEPIGLIFFLFGEVMEITGFELGRVSKKYGVEVDFGFIFDPADLQKILERAQSTLKE